MEKKSKRQSKKETKQTRSDDVDVIMLCFKAFYGKKWERECNGKTKQKGQKEFPRYR